MDELAWHIVARMVALGDPAPPDDPAVMGAWLRCTLLSPAVRTAAGLRPLHEARQRLLSLHAQSIALRTLVAPGAHIVLLIWDAYERALADHPSQLRLTRAAFDPERELAAVANALAAEWCAHAVPSHAVGFAPAPRSGTHMWQTADARVVVDWPWAPRDC